MSSKLISVAWLAASLFGPSSEGAPGARTAILISHPDVANDTAQSQLVGMTVPAGTPERNNSATETKPNNYPPEVSRVQAEEADFRDREEPEAIRAVAKKMGLSNKVTVAILEWRASFRLSVRAVWVQAPYDWDDGRRKGKVVARLRADLDRREMGALGERRYYQFQRLLAKEMNRRRWLRDGLKPPSAGKVINAD